VEIRDNGQGFDVSRPRDGGLGLSRMRERAEQLGGRLTITSSLGAGTRIVAELPDVPTA
jgi:signal transduction histidine kinase